MVSAERPLRNSGRSKLLEHDAPDVSERLDPQVRDRANTGSRGLVGEKSRSFFMKRSVTDAGRRLVGLVSSSSPGRSGLSVTYW